MDASTTHVPIRLFAAVIAPRFYFVTNADPSWAKCRCDNNAPSFLISTGGKSIAAYCSDLPNLCQSLLTQLGKCAHFTVSFKVVSRMILVAAAKNACCHILCRILPLWRREQMILDPLGCYWIDISLGFEGKIHFWYFECRRNSNWINFTWSVEDGWLLLFPSFFKTYGCYCCRKLQSR